MRTRQYTIAIATILVIWVLMPDHNRTVISTAPGLSGSFTALDGVQIAAAKAAPEAGLAVIGPPTITVAEIERVLADYHSPAAGHGQEIYDLGVKYGINP